MTLRLPIAWSRQEWQPFEAAARRQGYAVIAGIDEVGRGCLAGPVVACAVVLPDPVDLKGVNDSKKLTPARREVLSRRIVEVARAVAIGQASPEEIDRINILQATHLAMRRALEQLSPAADYVLIDGNSPLPIPIAQKTIIKGDSLCLSIAAASIVAKVTRDGWMAEAAGRFPQYGFDRHKGYGTADHLEAIERFGPCELHRRSFRGVLPEGDRASRSEDALEMPLLASTRPAGGERT